MVFPGCFPRIIPCLNAIYNAVDAKIGTATRADGILGQIVRDTVLATNRTFSFCHTLTISQSQVHGQEV